MKIPPLAVRLGNSAKASSTGYSFPLCGAARCYRGSLDASRPKFQEWWSLTTKRFTPTSASASFGTVVKGVYGADARARIVDRFEAIDGNVRVATTPTDGLFLAEAALSVDADGDLVECGCFQGGSTAKLSILASVTGRRLIVFDSFAGLPEADEYNQQDLHVRLPRNWMNPWNPGDWAGSLDTVTANVERFGEISACRFVKGWFEDTLKSENLPARVALAFTDVDLPSSARECLLGIWPRLAERSVYFSHDVAFIKVLKELNDELIWREVLREPVPIMYGAGYGLGDTSRMLGFMVKGRDVSPEVRQQHHD